LGDWKEIKEMSEVGQKKAWAFKRRLWRLFKFCLSALIIYFVVKAPVMWLLTDILGVHYILSGAVAGALPTLLMFIPSEWWIWKPKKKQ